MPIGPSLRVHSAYLIKTYKNEPPNDKTNKINVRPVKTQISLGIRPVKTQISLGIRPVKTPISLGILPVWSESSLGAQWVAKDPSFLHTDSEDSDQAGRIVSFC